MINQEMQSRQILLQNRRNPLQVLTILNPNSSNGRPIMKLESSSGPSVAMARSFDQVDMADTSLLVVVGP